MNEDLDIKRFELEAQFQEQQKLEHLKWKLRAQQLLDQTEEKLEQLGK